MNVLLTSEDKIKLIDFGLARVIGASTHSVTTPPYMSPEIVKEESYSFQVDTWGLGCILYELMTLKRPFCSIKQFEL